MLHLACHSKHRCSIIKKKHKNLFKNTRASWSTLEDIYVIHRLEGLCWEKVCPRSCFIFFLLRFKSFRKIFLHSPTYVC